MLRIPHCLDNRLIDGSKVVSPTHQLYFTPQKHYYFNVSGTHFYLYCTQKPGDSSTEFKCLFVMMLQEGNFLTHKIMHLEIHSETLQTECKQKTCMFSQYKSQTLLSVL
jgi:hypothetical protein